jgi:hypothetical protein
VSLAFLLAGRVLLTHLSCTQRFHQLSLSLSLCAWFPPSTPQTTQSANNLSAM